MSVHFPGLTKLTFATHQIQSSNCHEVVVSLRVINVCLLYCLDDNFLNISEKLKMDTRFGTQGVVKNATAQTGL